jgi:flagellar biosynthesis/type III secretory pathway M-ring protein FliF/YscJ
MNKKNIIILAAILVVIAVLLTLINSMRKPSGQPLDQKIQSLNKQTGSPADPAQSQKTLDELNNSLPKPVAPPAK